MIPIHALREEGDLLQHVGDDVLVISIHALREEGDSMFSRTFSCQQNFYPRPPRGGRLVVGNFTFLDNIFLSTPSARRATHLYSFIADNGAISIHALREEGDPVRAADEADCLYFYPRPPRGGRPELRTSELRRRQISIHALREEGDCPRCPP